MVLVNTLLADLKKIMRMLTYSFLFCEFKNLVQCFNDRHLQVLETETSQKKIISYLSDLIKFASLYLGFIEWDTKIQLQYVEKA